ncbi:hypothetical protein GOP47_0002376 [Adiantum capillus-veneris]|uniref:C3H1-type domain-containing protein n=1 Tax=Adiantum capillus-veneris TaxID=13818 RepID=A0A9D4VAH8_ADICA|nr:hypothetical protein GOP47_0002376 [Adiantum capillus-veneris]
MDQSATSVSHDTQTDLEGSLQQLKLQDCSYFLRTGTCAFGSKCRYNHPTAEKLVVLSNNNVEDLPERPGQMECQFFMKTGTCKFGPACWYHHPRLKSATNGSGQLQLNFLGLPLRPGEKECTYYLQTGSCKYGSTCRFHHPEPMATESVQPSLNFPTNLPNGLSTPTPVTYQDQGTTWPMARAPFMSSPMGMPRPLNVIPFVTSSPQHIPVTGPNPFQQPGQALQTPTSDRSCQVLPARGVDYPHAQGQFTTGAGLGKPTATILHGQTIFPERPGQPDCHHYMKTGDCKFGLNCKYHHPKDRAMSLPSGLNPMGLPLRVGKQACPYYVKHGICKFGPVCKFDHPVNVLPYSPPYSPSLSSLNEMPVAPYVPESSPSVSPGSTVSERLQNTVKGDESNANKEPLTQASGVNTANSTRLV